MSEPLVINTAFSDIEALAEAFAGRFDPEQLILYGPTSYEPGERIAFSLNFEDGSAVLSGEAAVLQVIDGGEERHEGTRYDIFLGELRIDDERSAAAQVLFGTTQLNASNEEPAEDVEEHHVDELDDPLSVTEEHPIAAIDLPADENIAEDTHDAYHHHEIAATDLSLDEEKTNNNHDNEHEAPLNYQPPEISEPPWYLEIETSSEDAFQLLRQRKEVEPFPESEPYLEGAEPTGYFNHANESFPIPQSPLRPNATGAHHNANAGGLTLDQVDDNTHSLNQQTSGTIDADPMQADYQDIGHIDYAQVDAIEDVEDDPMPMSAEIIEEADLERYA